VLQVRRNDTQAVKVIASRATTPDTQAGTITVKRRCSSTTRMASSLIHGNGVGRPTDVHGVFPVP